MEPIEYLMMSVEVVLIILLFFSFPWLTWKCHLSQVVSKEIVEPSD